MVVYKKRETEASVLDAALERIHTLYDRYDKVVVSFSGGKDSTVCLNLALQVARERGKLPLDVYFFDEEAIAPTTVEYVRRVASIPDIRFKWLCVPVSHRNACSRRQPYWCCWDEADRDKWLYPLPHDAIQTYPGFEYAMPMPIAALAIYGPEHGTVAHIRGIRADESMRRYQSVASKAVDNWIAGPVQPRKTKEGEWETAQRGHVFNTSPIYDWTTIDVWSAPRLFGWDYNRTYDVYSKLGIPPSVQRVCMPYGEEPLRALWLYAQGFPDLWHRMMARLPGVATAARYAQSELYGFGKIELPAGHTWRSWTTAQIDLYEGEWRGKVAENIRRIMAEHRKKTKRPIPEEIADPLTGLSWKFLAMIANRGDFKGRRAQMLITQANRGKTADRTEIDAAKAEAASEIARAPDRY